MSKNKKILLGVTGSIAAYKSADIIRRLCERGHKVSVIMTLEAQRFITPLTLGTLCGEKVHVDMFDDSSWQMNHIALAKAADVFLIAPATANIISKIATGIADDLICSTALVTSASMVIAPAMNEQMYKNKILQGNIKKLKELGFIFIDPVEGNLACGVHGEGHLAEVDDIVSIVSDL